jgi:hypothetical protein
MTKTYIVKNSNLSLWKINVLSDTIYRLIIIIIIIIITDKTRWMIVNFLEGTLR